MELVSPDPGTTADSIHIMLSNQKIGARKKAEKARALLALAAESKAEQGLCLTADEMAGLVDGSYEGNELAAYRDHLTSCEKCYGEWVYLKKMEMPGNAGARIFRLSRFKKYSYIGSALAAAASVAVFLNIYPLPRGADENGAPESVVRQQASVSSSVQIPLEKEEMDIEGSVESEESRAPAAKDALRKRGWEVKSAPVAEGKEILRGVDKKYSVPAVRFNSMVLEKGVVEEVIGDEASAGFRSAGRAPADIDSWLGTVKESCETGRSEPDFWSKIYIEGEMILKKQSGSLAGEMQEKAMTVLRLLAQVNGDLAKDQCQEIIALLDKDGPTTTTR